MRCDCNFVIFILHIFSPVKVVEKETVGSKVCSLKMLYLTPEQLAGFSKYKVWCINCMSEYNLYNIWYESCIAEYSPG